MSSGPDTRKGETESDTFAGRRRVKKLPRGSAGERGREGRRSGLSGAVRAVADHFHARCLACGKVRDVGGGSVPRSLSTIEPAEGFRIEGYNLEVVGYCADCAA